MRTQVAATTPYDAPTVLFVLNTDKEPVEEITFTQCSTRKFRVDPRPETFEVVRPYGGQAMECRQIFDVRIVYLVGVDQTTKGYISSDREALAVNLLRPTQTFPSVLVNIEIVPGPAPVRIDPQAVLVATVPFLITYDTAAP